MKKKMHEKDLTMLETGYVRYAHTYAHTYTSMVSYFRSGRSRLGARGIYSTSHFFLPSVVHLLDSQYMHIFALTLIYQ